MSSGGRVSVIVIGRNEGARLAACLESIRGVAGHIVYVDSGSTDGSQETATRLGAEVVDLDMSTPFTAARARNAGLERLSKRGLLPGFVQLIDGDCVLHPNWLETAQAFLTGNSNVAVVTGRLRERFPETSVYNRLCDAEWDTPIGELRACGGIAMVRSSAIDEVGRFNPTMIAGEEPELCVRLRRAGWRIWRLDAEMALHDAAMTRFGQWWKRMRRGGYAYAEAVSMHGAPPEYHGVFELRSILFWGIGLPFITLIGSIFSPWALLLLLVWLAQMVRLRARGMPLSRSFFLLLGKFAELQGAITYWYRRLRRTGARLIEYK